MLLLSKEGASLPALIPDDTSVLLVPEVFVTIHDPIFCSIQPSKHSQSVLAPIISFGLCHADI